MQYILNEIESDANTTVIDAWKKFSIMDCIKHAALASSEIKPLTLTFCCKGIWPECVKGKETCANDNTGGELHADIINLAREFGDEGLSYH